MAGRLASFPSSMAANGTPSVQREFISFKAIGVLQLQTTTRTRNGDTVNIWVSCLCRYCKFKRLLSEIK